MSLTLEQNGVPDERELYAKLNLVRAELLPSSQFFADRSYPALSPAQPDDFYAPLIHLYFNDDLTEA